MNHNTRHEPIRANARHQLQLYSTVPYREAVRKLRLVGARPVFTRTLVAPRLKLLAHGAKKLKTYRGW